MKAKSLCASTLVAILGVTVLGAATPAFAAPTELTSEGTVKVTEGTAGGGESETVDPENPGEVLPTPDPESPDENTNTEQGSLVIEKTTDLDFGSVKTSANTVTSYAKPMTFNGGTTKRGAYVQWADVRAGGVFGYTITAQLTKQFTSGTNVLSGSTIDFSNGLAAAQGDNTNAVPSNVQTGFQLTEAANDAKTVVVADKDKKEGKGRHVLEFGQSSTSQNGTPGTDAESVKLTIPAATASNMAVADYTATVTWKITAAPTAEETPEETPEA
ncbi:WxL domain-containing protein [Enterococcus plantarum]|uniref:WxL domain-containing protein n=1 Tax=Enterococcus TaxID=1350 RepID=UPI001A9074E4|nr:WxL domain-containing protein [Enterococcus plantarum]MBO0421641.1 WxL domain-containing protein [Enterococcus plantarum]